MSTVRLLVEGEEPVDGLIDLSDWLRAEPELRGMVALSTAVPSPGELGGLSDALVIAVSSGGALTVLAASLRAFLAQPRRSDIRIVVHGPEGHRVEVDAKRVGDVEALLREVLRGGR
ncbi:effector-associated constant component EACC1 [Streptomyces xiamenensis]|uniref:effector-associated constant component EACC1 n=1 Tax=Streptomyces xiamenensis TaxID=408015 RepID=UPI00062883AB|nr:hypothetical protein [Streptomyces xiamenensis]